MAKLRNKTDWRKEQIEQDIYRELIEEFSERLHEEIKPLEDTHLASRPGPHLNPIGFLYYHILRSWERDVNHLILGQAQAEDAWHRLNLVAETGFNPDGTGYQGNASGSGYTDAEVDALPKGKVYLHRYHETLFAETMAYLDKIGDGYQEFSRDIYSTNSPFNPFTPRWRMQHLITHSHRHIGDIQFVKGMLGISDITYPGELTA